MQINEIRPRLKAELDQWFIRQCRNTFDDYYLYYLESNAEHDGGFVIAKDPPPNKDYKLAWNQKIHKGATVEQNYNELIPVINKLPILDV